MPKASSKAAKTRTVRHTLSDGTVKEYTYAVKAKVRTRTTYEPNSVGALILAYENSPEFRALSPATKAGYKVYVREFHALKGHPAAEVTRRILLMIRDAIASKRGNGAGTGFSRVASSILAWAVGRDWIQHNPMAGAKKLPGGSLAAWTEAEARLAMRDLPEHLRRVVVLAYHTGQRRADLARLPWTAYDGQTIRLRQQKTGMALVLPVHPDLKVELDAWAKDRQTVTILTAFRGKPWTPHDISRALPLGLADIGIARRINVHGLRKLAATRLAEAGCSAHEIAAITGHKSLSMVQMYTASADQERLASAAVVRLQTPNKPIKSKARR